MPHPDGLDTFFKSSLPDTATDRIAPNMLPFAVPGPHGQPLVGGPVGAMTDEQRQLHYRRLRTRRMRDTVDRIYEVLAIDMDLRIVAEELDYLDLAIGTWRREIQKPAEGGAV